MAFTNINYNDPAAMDPLVKALIYRESRGNPNAVSPVGAQGLGQVMPATAANPGFGVAPLKNPFDPAENEAFTRKYLAAMLSRYNGDAGTQADYIVVEMARHLLGENWLADYVDKANNGGIERVLL